MATGVQYIPRAAKVAYAFAIVRGDTSWVPRAIEGRCCSLPPSARPTPIFAAISVTGQTPMSLISCT